MDHLSEEPTVKNNDSIKGLSLSALKKTVNTGNLCELATELYKLHGGILFKAAAIIYSPVFAGSALLCLIAIVAPETVTTSFLWIWAMGIIPFELFAIVFLPAVFAKITSDSLSEKEVDLWESIAFIKSKVGNLLSASFATGITIVIIIMAMVGTGYFTHYILKLAGFDSGLLFILTLVTAIPLLNAALASVAFSTTISVLENKSWFAAPIRSMKLTTAAPYALIRLTFVVFIIGAALKMIVRAEQFLALNGGELLAQLANSIGISMSTGATVLCSEFVIEIAFKILVTPWFTSIVILAYFAHRVKYEKLSIETLREKDEGITSI